MTETCDRPFLGCLPDELLLNMLSHFHVIRSFETQSEAFKLKEEEKQRQRENWGRQKALRSICLTSKRLRSIAEPILYSAYIGTCTRNGLEPLRLFLRSVQEVPALGRCVQYIENRLGDYKGNSLYNDTETSGAPEMVKEYLLKLATVVNASPNVVHLSLVSIEAGSNSLWEDLLFDKQSPAKISSHGLRKLETLYFQMHTGAWSLQEERGLFQRISHALANVPKLHSLCADGPVSAGILSKPEGQYELLETLRLSNCVLDFDELLELTLMCKKLKHFSCHWAFLNAASLDLVELRRILFQHNRTLEHFHLDAREVRTVSIFLSDNHQPLGSFKHFECLKVLEVDEESFLATVNSLLDFPDIYLRQHRISQLLPVTLEAFTLLMSGSRPHNGGGMLDEVPELWDLADDCPTRLPNLKIIVMQSNYPLSAPRLTPKFERAGIKLELR
ncbi:hypothetical protein P154DRAFT_483479 [Amniculicola lignicola CBS 123094]|uniref:F-box domain-containing protein n=1 Tax=Amniculicola lignicola CBS 123094 TaxID=1392246 RepID=A0A6A5WUK9_9PLEO|nr:hypothetical protein P154DRAFT_483479 [Amniculicola lignicola CBS 123094]